MSIAVQCRRCRRELEEPGGLAFGPPDIPSGSVEKLHLCRSCWYIVRAVMTFVPPADPETPT